MEFWGDEVEEIRSFSVADQRTLEPAARLWAPPCRELLLTDEVRARARELGEEHPQLAEISEKIADGHAVEGMESLAPVLVDEMEMLVDLLPERDPRAGARPRAGPQPRPRPGGDQRGVPRGVLGGGGRRRRRRRSTWARRRTTRSADVRAHQPRAGQGLVERVAVRPGPRRGRRRATGARCATRWARSCPPAWTPRPAPWSRGRCRCGPVEAYRGDMERAVADIQAWLANDSRVVLRARGPRPGPADGRGAQGARRRGALRRVARRRSPSAGWCTSPPRPSSTGSSTPASAWRCSPATTCPASARPPRTCARCRPGARSRSTRSSSRPATTSSTSSTASAATSR